MKKPIFHALAAQAKQLPPDLQSKLLVRWQMALMNAQEQAQRRAQRRVKTS